ncbi:MAG: DMT family transporter [Phormidesmis sp.]
MTDSPKSPAADLENSIHEADSDADTDQTGSLLLGAFLITVGFLANTIQGALGKTAQTAIEPGQFLWLLIVMALTVLAPVEIVRGGRNLAAGWNREIFPYYLLRAVFGLSGFYLFIWAAGLGSLVSANVLLNTTPVFIPVIGVLVLGKEISRTLWGAIAIGFIGLLLVVQPNAELLSNPANLLGLGAGLSAAVEFLTVRHLSQTQSSLGQTLYYLLIGSVLLAPVALWQWHPLTLETLKIVAAAAGSFLSFQLLMVQAYRYAEPHQIGIFQYSSVIFAAIIGWLFFNEVPNLLSVMGMALISLGGALSVYLEQRPQPGDLAVID